MCLCKGGNYKGFPIGFLIPAANNEFILCSLFCWGARAPLGDLIQCLSAPGPSEYILNEIFSNLDNRWAQLFKEESLGSDISYKKHCFSVFESSRSQSYLFWALWFRVPWKRPSKWQGQVFLCGEGDYSPRFERYYLYLLPRTKPLPNSHIGSHIAPKCNHTISSTAAISFPNIVYLVFILEQFSGVRFLPVKALAFPLPDSKWIIYGLISEIDINWC